MKRYIMCLVFILLGYISLSQEDVTMVIMKDSNNIIEQTGYLDQDGKKDSIWTQYNAFGVVIGIGSYSHGIKDGYWYCYNDSGRKIFEVYYIHGEKRKGKQWDDTGHLIDKRKW